MRNSLSKEPASEKPKPLVPASPLISKILNQALGARFGRVNWGPLPVVIGLILIWLFFQSQNDKFLTPRNLSNLVLQIGVVTVLATGVVLVLLLGEIDLSLGAVTGATAGFLGVLLVQQHWSGLPAIFAVLGMGILIGILQGSIIVYIGVPAFIVTLAGFLAWGGVQEILVGSSGEMLIQDELLRSLASTYLDTWQSIGVGALVLLVGACLILREQQQRRQEGLETLPLSVLALRLVGLLIVIALAILWFDAYYGIPLILVIAFGVMAVLTWLTRGTIFGRYIYAIGGNAEAARRAGINTGLVKIAVFAITSGLAALGGILSASREFAVSTGTGGGTLLLEAIAAAVIGGTSLFGGRGHIYHAALGALVIGSVENGLDLLGQPSSTKNIATGIILVIAVSVDALSRKYQAVR